MKKILLSCVTCLLALGLVTACNNEDEDVSGGGGDSTTQDTGTGGGTGGGTTEAVTLTNYTLAISFVEDDVVTPLEGVDLYISGDWNSWGFDICTLGDDGVYTLTIASIEVGSYEYKGVTVVTGETPASDWSNVEEVITGSYGATGNALLTVTAAEGDNYTQKIEVVLASDSDEPPEGSTEGITINISLYDSTNTTTALTVPEYLDVYILWTTDNWATQSTPVVGGSGMLTLEEGGYYSYVFNGRESLTLGDTVIFTLFFEHNTASSLEWLAQVTNNTFTVPTEYDGTAISVSVYASQTDVSAIEPLGSDTNFYVVVVDTGSTTSLDSLEWYGFACASSFTLETATNYSAGASATSSDGKLCVYSSTYATVAAGGSEWFSLYATEGWDDEIQFGTISDIPSTEADTYAILVGYADLSKLGSGSSKSNVQYTNSTHTWITDVPVATSIEDYIASATLAYSGS